MCHGLPGLPCSQRLRIPLSVTLQGKPGEDPPRCNDATCQKDVLVGDIGRDKTHRAFGLKTSPVRVNGAKHGRNQEKRVRDWEIEELVGL